MDAGTGLGDIARGLAPDCIERVDAVDFSEGMIEKERPVSLPSGGDDPRIRWVCAPIEEVDLVGPYSLITAAASLHWFDLDVVIPRFAELLTENGVLAVVERSADVGMREDDIIPRYSLNRDYVRWDPVTSAGKRRLVRAPRPAGDGSGPVETDNSRSTSSDDTRRTVFPGIECPVNRLLHSTTP